MTDILKITKHLRYHLPHFQDKQQTMKIKNKTCFDYTSDGEILMLPDLKFVQVVGCATVFLFDEYFQFLSASSSEGHASRDLLFCLLTSMNCGVV